MLLWSAEQVDLGITEAWVNRYWSGHIDHVRRQTRSIKVMSPEVAYVFLMIKACRTKSEAPGEQPLAFLVHGWPS